MTPDSAWIFDNTTYTVTAQAVNPTSRILTRYVSWDNGAAFMAYDTNTVITYTYSSSGSHSVKVYVVDTKGLKSTDTLIKSIFVRQGTQTITAISTDTAINKIYVLDPITFTVTGATSHGTIDSIKVAWKGDTNWNISSKATAGAANFQPTFALGAFRAGQRKVQGKRQLWVYQLTPRLNLRF